MSSIATTSCLIILCLLFCIVVLSYCCIAVLFPRRSYQSSRCLAVCFRVMSESCRSCQGNVWIMSGSCHGHVMVMSGSCQGHFRVMSGSCQVHVRVMSGYECLFPGWGSCYGYVKVFIGLCFVILYGCLRAISELCQGLSSVRSKSSLDSMRFQSFVRFILRSSHCPIRKNSWSNWE